MYIILEIIYYLSIVCIPLFLIIVLKIYFFMKELIEKIQHIEYTVNHTKYRVENSLERIHELEKGIMKEFSDFREKIDALNKPTRPNNWDNVKKAFSKTPTFNLDDE